MPDRRLLTLRRARDALDGANADQPLMTWFGIQNNRFTKAALVRKLSFLRAHITNSPITFSFTADDHPDQGMNADAIPINLRGGNGQNSYGAYRQLLQQNVSVNIQGQNVRDNSVVRLGRNFRNLPDYSTRPLSWGT